MDHGGCSIIVGIKDNRIVKIKGDPEGFLNKGYVCVKGTVSHKRLSHPDRLTHPLKRIGDRGEGALSLQLQLEAEMGVGDSIAGVGGAAVAGALHVRVDVDG